MAEQSESHEQDVREGRLERFGLPLVFGVAIPLFTGAAYLTGIAYHQAYLSAFRIPQNLLAKSAADYFLYAYMAVAESGIRLLGITGLIIILAFIFSVYFWQGFNWLERKTAQSSHIQWIRNKANSRPFLRVLRNLVLVPTIVLGLSYLIVGLFVLFIMPMMFGQEAGARRAAQDVAVYVQGCDKVRSGSQFCVDIFEDGKSIPVSSGFVIDSSEKYIAIYQNSAIRTFPVEGKIFIASKKNQHPK